MPDATGIRAGGLYWEVDAKEASNVRARVQAIGRELDKALNTKHANNAALTRLSKDAGLASKGIVKLTTDYVRFTNRVRDGGVELDKLARGLQKAGSEADKTTQEYRNLASLTRSVEAAQGKLATAASNSATQTEKQRAAAVAQAEATRKQAQALAFLATNTTDVSARVGRISENFSRLKSSFDLGQIEAREYAARLADLATGVQRTGNMAGLSTKELKTLATTFNQVKRAQEGLGTGTQTVNQRVASLVNQVRLLRNDWQKTGKATDETKNKLRALMTEMDRLGKELVEGENGWARYNAQVTRLSVAGRSAEATIAGMEGRMSRLGLASQVNLALTSQLSSSLYRLGPAGAVAGSSLGLVAGGAGALSAGMLATGFAVTGVALATAGLVRRGIPQVKEFESALRVLVATGEDFDATTLDEALRAASDAAGAAGDQFSRANIATSLAEIVKAGVDANDALKLLVPGMQLANIESTDLTTATSGLLGNLRQFGLTAADAQFAGDQLAEAALASAHGVAELSEGLATVGPVAHTAGLSFAETLGILVELDNKGLDPADKGSTGLRSALTALLDPTGKAAGAIRGLGVELKTADGRSRPVLDIMTDLRHALEGNAEAANIAAQIFDTRALPAFLNITDASDELAQRIADADGSLLDFSNTITDENLEKSLNSLQVAMDNLSATFTKDFADDIGRAALNLGFFLDKVDAILANPNKWERARQLINLVNPAWRIVDENAALFNATMGTGGAPSSGPQFVTPAVPLPSSADIARVLNTPTALVPTLAGAIAEARKLKAALEAAVEAGDAQAWIHATQAVDAFRASGDLAEQAWAAVAATSRKTTEGAKRDARTVQDIFDDLASGGKQAERAADAQGNTAEARATSLNDRLKLTQAALNELLAHPDVNQGDNPDKVSYLTSRAEELTKELKVAQTAVDKLAATEAARVKAAQEARDRVVESMRSATRQGLIETAERERIEALTATPEELQAAQEAAERIGASMAEATERGRQAAEDRLTRTRKARGLGAATGVFIQDTNDIFSDAEIASIESAVRLIQSLDAATSAGATATLARAEAEARLRAELDKREKISAKLVRLEEQQNAADARRIAREQERGLAVVRGAAAGAGAGSLAAILTPENQAAIEAGTRIIGSLNQATERGVKATKERREEEEKLAVALERRNDIVGQMTDATERDLQATEDSNESVDRLRHRILNLINNGYDPASEAVQRLGRQINYLNLQMALQELGEKGAKNLSDFARSVLEANGVMATMTTTGTTLLERLGALAGSSGSGGLSKFVRGLQEATAEGAETVDIIAGVVRAAEGLVDIAGEFNGEDLLDLAKGVGSIAAELIGTAAGIPGLGKVFGAVFDLGETIVRAISDSFTGDSPAARAIRDGLTPAITSAFTTGIINGIRGAEGWQDGLRDSLKTIFLQSLIQAFINGAIIQTILQPVIDQYSKLIASGNIEAATAYLRTALPGALDQAVAAAEGFAATIPAGFLSPAQGGGTQPGSAQQPGTFRLPDALPVGSNAAVATFGGYVGNFGTAVGSFSETVRALQERGITVTVGTTRGGGNGSPQAARAA